MSFNRSSISFTIVIVLSFLWTSLVLAVPSSRLTGSCNCVCGVRGRGNRIVSGAVVQPHEQPWVATMWRQGKFYCGATVISRNYLITAAHCLYGFEPSDIRIYIGGHDVSKDYTEIRKIKKVHDHENFDVVSFDNDVAVLELDRPIQYGPKVQPVCLPTGDINDYSGSLALVSGWGRLSEKGKPSRVLHSVAVPVWSHDQCIDAGYGKQRITNNMMCAGYHDGGKDACQGDSGGPMIIEGPTGSMEMIGVISWGRGCARPNFPGIYTKVANYLPWIRKKIAEECVCSPKNGERSNYTQNFARKY